MTPSALIHQWRYFAIQIADVTMRTGVRKPKLHEQGRTNETET